MNVTLKEIVKDNLVYFHSYRAGFFYYTVNFEKRTFQFPIDREDIGQATLNSNDKAIIYMRWIRKAMESGQFIEIETSES